jgi:PRTRC genetic system protein B
MPRTELLMQTYRPQVAIVVYKDNYGDNFYLESHSVNADGALMEGKPLKQETIAGMVDVFFDERKNMLRVTGFMPENILSFDLLPGGNYKMVWHRPAEVRVMHFSKALKLKTGKTWVPSVIYAVDAGSLSVFAKKTNNRPELKTALFRAPFHNVGDDGHVCLGSAKVKKPSVTNYESLMKYWEDLFWLSEFTHLNGASNPTKTDLKKVYTRLLKSKTRLKWSDLTELKQTPKTLKSLYR